MVDVNKISKTDYSGYKKNTISAEYNWLSPYAKTWSNNLMMPLPDGLSGNVVVHNEIVGGLYLDPVANPKFKGFYEKSVYVSEAQGYGMWITLGLNNEKAFRGLYSANYDTLKTNETGCFSWARSIRGACLPITGNGITGENAALDADVDILASSISAYNRYKKALGPWKMSQADLVKMRDNLVNHAKNIFEEGVEQLNIFDKNTNKVKSFYVLKSSDGLGRRDNVMKIYTSYISPASYRLISDFLSEVKKETNGFKGVTIVDLDKGRVEEDVSRLDKKYLQLHDDSLTLLEEISQNKKLRTEKGYFPAVVDLNYYPDSRRIDAGTYTLTVPAMLEDSFNMAETVRIPWRLAQDSRWYGDKRSGKILEDIRPDLQKYDSGSVLYQTTEKFYDYAKGKDVSMVELPVKNANSYWEGTVPLMYNMFLSDSVRPEASGLNTIDLVPAPYSIDFRTDSFGQVYEGVARIHTDNGMSARDTEVAKNYITGIKSLLNVSLAERIINGIYKTFVSYDQNDFAESWRYSEKLAAEGNQNILYYSLPFMTDIMKDMGIPGKQIFNSLENVKRIRTDYLNNYDIKMTSEEQEAFDMLDLAEANVCFSLDRRYINNVINDFRSRPKLSPILRCALAKAYILDRQFEEAQVQIKVLEQNKEPIIQVTVGHLKEMIRFQTVQVKTKEGAEKQIADYEMHLKNIADIEGKYSYKMKTDNAFLPWVKTATPYLTRDIYMEALGTYTDVIENSAKSMVLYNNDIEYMEQKIKQLRENSDYGFLESTKLLFPGTGTYTEQMLNYIQAQADTYKEIYKQQIDVKTMYMDLLVYKSRNRKNGKDVSFVAADAYKNKMYEHIQDELLENVTIYGDTQIDNAFVSPLKVMINLRFSDLQNRGYDQAGREAKKQEIYDLLYCYPKTAFFLDSTDYLKNRGALQKGSVTENEWNVLVKNNYIDPNGRILGKFNSYAPGKAIQEFKVSGIEDSYMDQIRNQFGEFISKFGRGISTFGTWLTSDCAVARLLPDSARLATKNFWQNMSIADSWRKAWGLNRRSERVFQELVNANKKEVQNRFKRMDVIGKSIYTNIESIYRDQSQGGDGYFFNAEQYLPFIGETATDLYWSGDSDLQDTGIVLLRSAYNGERKSENIGFQINYFKIMVENSDDDRELKHMLAEVERLKKRTIRFKGKYSKETLQCIVVIGNIYQKLNDISKRNELSNEVEDYFKNNKLILDNIPERIQLCTVLADMYESANQAGMEKKYADEAENIAANIDNLHLLSGPMLCWIYLKLLKATKNRKYLKKIYDLSHTWEYDRKFRKNLEKTVSQL